MTENIKLNQIADNQGATHNTKRVGRGIGSGKGKTSGRGVKGQKARKSGGVRAGFEGGQNPLYKRLPMRGFNNFNFRTEYCEVNVGMLQKLVDMGKLDANKPISIESVIGIGLTKKAKDGLKLLGNGELTSKLNIVAAHASASAAEKVARAGGKIEILAKKTYESGVKLKKQVQA
jgi:large subunit ribosomal protein L15